MSITSENIVLSFDLDDTIWACKPVLENATAAQHSYIANRFPELAQAFPPREFRKLSGSVIDQFPGKAHDLTWVRKKALEVAAKQVGLDPEAVVEPTFEIFISKRCSVQDHFFPGVLPMLRRLKERGFVLVSNTNGNADVGRIPELAELFSFSVTAESAGAAKPAAAPFRAVVKHCGVPPSAVVHVGDSVSSDVRGAKAAGMVAVWVKGSAAHNDGAVLADATINTCADLEAALESIIMPTRSGAKF